MGLQRKIRRAGHSIVVTLPSQLAEMADLAEGDIVEFEYLGRGALRIENRARTKLFPHRIRGTAYRRGVEERFRGHQAGTGVHTETSKRETCSRLPRERSLGMTTPRKASPGGGSSRRPSCWGARASRP